jgi:hypothetical protein
MVRIFSMAEPRAYWRYGILVTSIGETVTLAGV